MADLLEWFRRLGPWQIVLCSIIAALVLRLVLRLATRLTSRTRTDLDDRIVAALQGPLFMSVLFIGSHFALLRAGFDSVGRIDAILITIAVLLWLRAVMRISDLVLDAFARRADDYRWIQPASLPLFEILTKLLLIGSAAYALLDAWGVDLTAWLASAGILGIAIGFAARDTLANLFAGVFILADAPYKLGDFIILDSGERGRVTDIGIRSTRLLTRDDIEITLPNAVIANAKITNEAGGPYEKRRVHVAIGVAYGSDIDLVRKVLLEIAADCEHLAQEPPPAVRFRNFGDSALDFQLRGWIDQPVLSGRTIDALNTAIYKRFQAEKIEIPFPQRDVNLKREA